MFGPLNAAEAARINQLPVINRARGGRLYSSDGRRWLDCWADGGRALLGHRPGGLSLRVKNEIDRGLYAPYPNRWECRLKKSLLRLFPHYASVQIYRNAEAAMRAVGLSSHPSDPLDLAGDVEGVSGALWGRPLLPHHPRADVLFPILPVSGITEAQPVLLEHAAPLPPSDPLSPIALAALTRSCGSLDGSKVLPEGKSSDIWERRGPYMLFRGDDEDYEAMFQLLFSRRVLIAPSRNRPSVHPPDISAKEAKLLAVTREHIHD